LLRIQEALEFHFEGMAGGGESIPPPVRVEAHFVDVNAPLPSRLPNEAIMSEAGSMRFKGPGIRDEEFEGFVTFSDLRAGGIKAVPTCGGVYIVLYEGNHPPNFLDVSVGGWFKDKDPSVSRDRLLAKWVGGTDVVYIGKASSTIGLRKRLQLYMDFGAGRPVAHKGGRYIWQIENSHDLVVAWKCATEETAERLEARLQNEFCIEYGRLPFANLKKESYV
jgi:hypothetical protein